MRIWSAFSRSLLLLVPLTLGCSKSPSSRDSGSMMRAGPREPTFVERFGLTVQLPIQAEAFETALKSHNLKYNYLRYDPEGGKKVESALPLPRRNKEIDRNMLRGCFEIYGTHDTQRGSMEIFRAYVDENNRVFYIENAFSYTGP